MKRMLFTLLAALQLFGGAAAPETLRDDAIDIKAPSAVLMEKQSGEVIYEKNAHERMAPASVTKVMTMLLIVEAIENGDTTPLSHPRERLPSAEAAFSLRRARR